MPPGATSQSAAEKRLRKELDEELQRSNKRSATTTKPHLENLGQTGTSGAAATAPAAEGDIAIEEPSSEEEEAVGFWGQLARKRKKEKKRKEVKPVRRRPRKRKSLKRMRKRRTNPRRIRRKGRGPALHQAARRQPRIRRPQFFG